MSEDTNPFDPRPDELPATLPIFPLPGVLLLPGGRLPLNVFEPRYLSLVRTALAESRMIGMVQPADEDCPERAAFECLPPEEAGGEGDPDADPGSGPVYRVGCAGRIVSFSETKDGRFLITLRGVTRFRIEREYPTRGGVRRVVPAFDRYLADLKPQQPKFDRVRLLEALAGYFEQQGIEADWDAIQQAPDCHLVTSLAMVCPFSSGEKQTLLEAPDITMRAQAMTSMLEMAILGGNQYDIAPSRH
ncbi:hypothetical protein SAMN05216241_105162 [Limimonas halophila]|uniref:Lon N-terminal domain-containing protein n=1 Tax=Limimonas halophila TaxID=1082479 RepID=A0A1G7RJT7_9PROT|nr:LON peptidase substrate-binding domain-containing protein [Limimonas halophila]SDG11012.1 hypothetical protein SAMN05216241_105162 [Limimonas halophila]